MKTLLFFFTRQGSDMSRDNEKVFHRSLDILYFWIADYKQVDFTPKSSLVDTLEVFLNTEVIAFSIQFALLSWDMGNNNGCTKQYLLFTAFFRVANLST